MAEPSSRRPASDPAQFRVSQSGQGAHPAVVICTLVALLGAIAFFVYRYVDAKKGPVVEQAEKKDDTTARIYAAIKKDIPKAMKLKREAFALKNTEDTEAFNAKCEAAKAALRDILDRLDAMLAEVRDENGELHDDYSGYSQDYDRVNTALLDVVKSSNF